jgi:HK97 family phage major capsid protein
MTPEDEGQGTGTGTGTLAMTHPQVINRLHEIRDAMSQIAELDNPSEEDDKYFHELADEFDKVDSYRLQLERKAELDRVKKAASGLSVSRSLKSVPGTAPGAVYGNGSSGQDEYDVDAFNDPDSVRSFPRGRNPWDLREMRTYGRSRESVNAELRSRAMDAIEVMPSANDRIRGAATDIVERFDDKDATLAKMAVLASSPDYVRAFSKAATNRLHSLTEGEHRALEAVRALSLTDSAGGYLIPFQLDPTVIVTANGSRNDIRRIARQVVATGDVWNGVTAGAVAWSWDAEAAEVSDDAPTFAPLAIPVYKAAGFVPISIEAIQDMANGAAEVARLLSVGRDSLESAAFALGSGVGQPTGVITGLVGTGAVTPSGTADTLAVGDLYNLQGSLPARYRSAASWLASNLFYNKARQFDTAGGSSLWAQLGDDRPALLLGKPIYEAEDMDGTVNATQENYIAVFGDFENFVIADRIGSTVEFIPHLFGATRRPTGQRGWYAYYRTGSGVTNPAGFKLLNVT